MSKESVQFIEMVRQAASQVNRYCEQCGKEQPHRVTQSGREEIYTCKTCGYQKWFTVR